MPLAELAEGYKRPRSRSTASRCRTSRRRSPRPPTNSSSRARPSRPSAGISLQNVLDALDKDAGNTTYEKLECLGSSIRPTRPAGRDLPPRQDQRLLGRAVHGGQHRVRRVLGRLGRRLQVRVSRHGRDQRPRLRQAAGRRPVLRRRPARRSQPAAPACERPVLRHVRAVLSWGTPPSITDPDLLPHWGNRLDTHVQIAPGRPYDGTARFVIVGGVPAAEIDPHRADAAGRAPGRQRHAAGRPRLPVLGPDHAARAHRPGTRGQHLSRAGDQPHGGRHADAADERFKTVGGLGQTLPSPTTNWLPGAEAGSLAGLDGEHHRRARLVPTPSGRRPAGRSNSSSTTPGPSAWSIRSWSSSTTRCHVPARRRHRQHRRTCRSRRRAAAP